MVKNGDRFFLFNDAGELIIAKLSPKGYEEIDRAKVIEPTGHAMGRDVVYSMPGVRQQAHVRAQRQGADLRVAGEGVTGDRRR